MTSILLAVLAGLILFLYAVSRLSEIIKAALGEDARRAILRFTSNTFTGILTGTVLTAILGSSSAVIIITIVFVNSRLLTFRQAMGIVLGANIGTTVSSQIIALDIGQYAPVLLLAGFVMMLAGTGERIRRIGKIILYFGVLFFGLFTIENAVEPLRDEPFFMEWLKRTDDPLTGALVGTVVTLIVQSSSATVGMAIVLAKKGFLSLAGGVAVMLGAELGTVSDTLLATIKGSRQALKTGVFHLIFNLLTIIAGLLFFHPFVRLVEQLSAGSSLERTVANAHMLFNVCGVFLFAWTVPFMERLLHRWLPDRVVSEAGKGLPPT